MLSDAISLSVFIEEFMPWQIVEQYAFIQNLYSNLKGKLYANKSAHGNPPRLPNAKTGSEATSIQQERQHQYRTQIPQANRQTFP